MVRLTINGKEIQVPEGTTVLQAAAGAGIRIPTLCHWEGINEIGACRVCAVEQEGHDRLLTACNTVVEEGMVLHTNSKKAREARRINVQLILSEHDCSCPTCVRNGNCALQSLAGTLNSKTLPAQWSEVPGKKRTQYVGKDAFPLVRDDAKCIKCMRCVQVCDAIQDSHVWDVVGTGSRTTVGVTGAYRLEDAGCALCGQCLTHCPVGALKERDDGERVFEALENPDRIVVAQIAPAIRTSWGEEFGLGPEEATVERLAAALKELGFDYIFDTNFAADLTIMEEGTEFLEKLQSEATKRETESGRHLPMFTSCCPGWVRYVKRHFPEYVKCLSTAKSPQQMFGAVLKSYYAELLNVEPERLFCVSVMPCLAKKEEAAMASMRNSQGRRDVDAVLTAREVNRMIRSAQIAPGELSDRKLDQPFGTASGAGTIFGATGGVMEAALRTAYYASEGKNPSPDAFRAVRGMDGIRESEFDLMGRTLKVAVVNGLGNAGRLLTELQAGRVAYDFVEVMACPGGCVGGGGQPIHDRCEWAADRAPVLYAQDQGNPLRFSHENPSIQAIYRDYLGAPLSEKAHHLLHVDHTADGEV